jgi:hypothetical protein
MRTSLPGLRVGGWRLTLGIRVGLLVRLSAGDLRGTIPGLSTGHAAYVPS